MRLRLILLLASTSAFFTTACYNIRYEAQGAFSVDKLFDNADEMDGKVVLVDGYASVITNPISEPHRYIILYSSTLAAHGDGTPYNICGTTSGKVLFVGAPRNLKHWDSVKFRHIVVSGVFSDRQFGVQNSLIMRTYDAVVEHGTVVDQMDDYCQIDPDPIGEPRNSALLR